MMEFLLERISDMGPKLCIGPVILVVGIGLLVSMVGKIVRARRRKAVEARVDGVVLGWETRRGRKGGNLHFPRVQYFSMEGARYEFTASVGSSFKTVSEGQTVTVRYLPGDPDSADMDSVMTNWFEIGVFGFMGCAFTVVGTIVVLVFLLI